MTELSSYGVRQLLYGSWMAQAVYAAARLDLADLVATGTGDVCELAERTETDPDALYRLMRALAGAGVFREEAPRRFGLTPMADCLRSGGEDSVKHLALFYGNEVFQCYGRIVDSVRTGAPAFDGVHGMGMWEYLQRVPAAGEAFRRGMGASSWREQLPLPQTYDFGGIRCLVDVGGGEGTMLAAILHELPELRGILVDIPGGLDPTRRHFLDAGVSDRCTIVEGSAFETLPAADGFLLSCVLHVMNDRESAVALGRVRDAIEPDGRLLIVERIVPPGNDPGLSKLLDLSMLVTNGGRERTEPEWCQILDEAGFVLTRIVPLPYFSGGIELTVIEARPATRD